ncbi:MAG: hypothetical protein GY791_07750 [Alphaproteobacteria bacterium]|nr:hypothetical protein [Alphaproteobacteria bacterium]
MKFTINIDCTPAEARAFLGLPNVEAMQEKLIAEIEKQMVANIKSMDPEAIFKTWLPASLQGVEQMQKMFWDQLAGAAKGGKKA